MSGRTNLERRVAELETRAGVADDFMLIIIASMECDPGKMGSEREIRREPVGYCEMGTGREWFAGGGESLDDVKQRIERDARAEGRRSLIVCERYGECASV